MGNYRQYAEDAKEVVDELGIKYDAILARGALVRVGEQARGEIWFDTADRFEDGTPIVTSTVQAISIIEGCSDLVLIKTRNTIYVATY